MLHVEDVRGSEGESSSDAAFLSGDAVSWTLWTCVPETANGYILLGEIGKYVTVSPDRFASISPTAAGLQVELVGRANEQVRVAYVNRTSVVRVVTVSLDSQGSAAVVLS